MGIKYTQDNIISTFFKGAFGGIVGIFVGMAIIGLISMVLILFGFSLVKKYNKPNTKLFQEITPGQFIGIIIMIIGIAPFIQYFIQAFLWNAGTYVFNSISEEF